MYLDNIGWQYYSGIQLCNLEKCVGDTFVVRVIIYTKLCEKERKNKSNHY